MAVTLLESNLTGLVPGGYFFQVLDISMQRTQLRAMCLNSFLLILNEFVPQQLHQPPWRRKMGQNPLVFPPRQEQGVSYYFQLYRGYFLHPFLRLFSNRVFLLSTILTKRAFCPNPLVHQDFHPLPL